MLFSQLISRITANPKSLFLIDGVGALLSAFLLGLVLVQLESVFGIPVRTLYFLASLPVLFALYDCYAFFRKQGQVGMHLKGIAIMNFLYCVLSIGLACYHIKVLSVWGWAYILAESTLVLLLASIEFQQGNRLIHAAR